MNIAADEGRQVSLDVLRREHPQAVDYWDGNWLWCRVSVQAGAFTGSFDASLRAEEFASLRDGVRRCIADFGSSFAFETMEGQVSIVAKGNGRGHFTAACSAQDAAGIGNNLTFEMSFDQTRLEPLLSQLDALLRAYPVIGKP